MLAGYSVGRFRRARGQRHIDAVVAVRRPDAHSAVLRVLDTEWAGGCCHSGDHHLPSLSLRRLALASLEFSSATRLPAAKRHWAGARVVFASLLVLGVAARHSNSPYLIIADFLFVFLCAVPPLRLLSASSQL